MYLLFFFFVVLVVFICTSSPSDKKSNHFASFSLKLQEESADSDDESKFVPPSPAHLI